MDTIEPSIIKTNNVIELLLNLYQKPHLYINSKSLIVVESFLDGFILAQYMNGTETEGAQLFRSFFDWLKIKFEYVGEKNFFSLVDEVLANEDNEEKYHTFFRLLNDFLKETNYPNSIRS